MSGASSQPIGRAFVCQRQFCFRLLPLPCSTAHRSATLPSGFFRQQIRFSRFAASFNASNRISTLRLTFFPLQFWSDMAELDENAWVLEPEAPNLADVHRRIVVAKHAYLDITIKYEIISSTFITHTHYFAVMRRILALLRLLWHWLAQRLLAHPCGCRLGITDGSVTSRCCTTFFLPCLCHPFLRLLELLAPVVWKKRSWLRWNVAFATRTACRCLSSTPFPSSHKAAHSFTSRSRPYPIKLVPIPSVQKRKPSSLNLKISTACAQFPELGECYAPIAFSLTPHRYHSSCLLQWMQSCASSRTSFSTIFGRCSEKLHDLCKSFMILLAQSFALTSIIAAVPFARNR